MSLSKLLPKSLASLALLSALFTAGCATSSLTTPSGFATHSEGRDYDFRASDGEGVVIAVRSEANRPRGDLQYWTAALDVQLRSAGYEIREAQDLKSADGHPGRQLRYAIEHQGRELTFWVSVFVDKRKVVVVEAGGDSEFFEAKVDEVEEAIRSVDLG